MSRLAAAVRALVLGVAMLAITGDAVAQADEHAADPIGARVEIGGGAGVTVAYPEVGALVSLPIGPQSSFEIAAGLMPRIIYEVEHTVVQAQFRLPFGAHRRSRRSLLLGVTRIGTRQRHAGDGGFWGDDLRVVFPHAGLSLQWPLRRHLDVRLDAQGLFTLDGTLPLVPRTVATFVWYRGPS